MTEKKVPQINSADLRSTAEQRLREIRGIAHPPGTGEEPLRLLYELQVHQIELEMQNEELRYARAEREQMEALLGKYSDLYDFAPVGYFNLDHGGIVRAVNLTGTVFLGVSRSLLIGRRLELFISNETRPVFQDFLDKVFTSETKETCEIVFQKERRSPLFVQVEAVLSESREECRAVVIDITQRIQAEKALRMSQFFIDKASLGILMGQGDAKILFANEHGARMLGYTQDELCSMNFFDIDPSLTPEFWLEHRKKLTDTGSNTFESVHRRKDGTIFPVEVTVNYLQFQGQVFSCSFYHDITERKRAEEALQKSRDELEVRVRERTEQLTSLTAELSLAEERERRRIATELHDQVGQTLILSKIKLESLSHALLPESFSKLAGEIREYLDQSIEEIRSLTFQLSPPLLYEVGLEAAVEWLGEEFEGKYGFRVEFQDDGKKKPLDEEASVALFQMVRELLLNIAKHAKAKKVRVSVGKVSDKIKISVADDGSGFELTGLRHKNKGSGFGLFNICHRIEYMGGRFKIKSKIDQGTSVTLMLPVKTDGNSKSRVKP
jgi:PAS domain S-box-containing protein